MPRPYRAEIQLRAVALVRAGKSIMSVAISLGFSQAALHGWVRLVRIDRGDLAGDQRLRECRT